MSARWEEREDGRNAGRRVEGGCTSCVVVAVMILAAVYFVAHVLVWSVLAVIQS